MWSIDAGFVRFFCFCAQGWLVLFGFGLWIAGLDGDGLEVHGFCHGQAHVCWADGDFDSGFFEGFDFGIGRACGFAACP